MVILFLAFVAVQLPDRSIAWNADEVQRLADAQQHWPSGRVNINTTSELELCVLPGIGPGRARKIVEYRQEHGPFRTINELTKVHGLGKKAITWFEQYAVVQE